MVTKSLFISDFITKTLVVGHLRLPVNDQKDNRPFHGYFSSFNKDPFLTSLKEHLDIRRLANFIQHGKLSE